MFDNITLNEVTATVRAADALAHVAWAQPLLAQTAEIVNNLRTRLPDREAGRPITGNDRAFFFELRFAEALYDSGLSARYEASYGVGASTVDFAVMGAPQWRIELVSLRSSDAVKAATTSNEAAAVMVLTSPRDGAPLSEKIQSEEGEIIKAQERIGQKAFDGKLPTKFPPPTEAIHMIMVDARGFIGGGGDDADWAHIARGAAGLSVAQVRLWTDPKTGKREPIAGLFEPRCPGRAAATVQERIHVIGFVRERTFARGEIARATCYIPNPAFESRARMGALLAKGPFTR